MTASASASASAADKYGIRKLYKDFTSAPQHWYMNMDSPTSDPMFKNWKNANLRKESDGGWSSDGSGNGKYQVRLEGWLNPKMVDCEITVYANFMADAGSNQGSYAYQTYRGGGHHTSTNSGCEGFAYKGRIRKDKGVVVCKEIRHPDYTSNKGGLKKLTKDPKGNYIGVKEVVYNLPKEASNGRTPVKLEVWCDETGMSSNGVLDPAKQNWIKMAEYTDAGGWSSGTGGGCPSLELGNTTGKRKPDEIGNTPGGTSVGNLCAYRSDGAKTKIKYFSCRKIEPTRLTTTTTGSATAATTVPTSTMTPTTLPPPVIEVGPPTEEELAAAAVTTYELELHKLVNAARLKYQLQTLLYDNALANLAEKHSIDMQQRDFFAHENPSHDDPFERATKAGYTGWTSYGENIAWFSTTRLGSMSKQEVAQHIFDQWWASAGHKANMLSSKYNREGLGIWTYGSKCWATQDFARK